MYDQVINITIEGYYGISQYYSLFTAINWKIATDVLFLINTTCVQAIVRVRSGWLFRLAFNAHRDTIPRRYAFPEA